MTELATRDETSSANDYRLFLHVQDDGANAVDGVVGQLASWLRKKKGWTPRLDRSGFTVDGGRDLLTIHRESSDGVEFRARLTESSPQGIWRTQVTVQQPRAGQPWVALTVSNSEGRWVAVPGLAHYLLDTLTLADGSTVISRDAKVVGPTGVDDLLDEVCDPDRQGLYFVAGSRNDEISFSLFTEQVERWSRQVKGLAQIAVLTPEATEAVRERLGQDHFVRPWTVRTFYPSVDPAVASDGLRHRYLTRQRLVDEPDESIRQLLGRIARRHAALLPTPNAFLHADRALRRLEDRLLVDAISQHLVDTEPETITLQEPIVVDTPVVQEDSGQESTAAEETLVEQAESYLALVEMVKKTLGIEELNEATLAAIAAQAQQSKVVTSSIDRVSEKLDERQAEVEALKVELEASREQYEEMQLDERVAAERASKLEDEARWLRARLDAVGDHQGAHGGVPAEAYTVYPTDFDDLHSRMKDLAAGGVHFTGDPAPMLGLDEYDTLGKLVTTCWDALLVLADYLRARRDGACETNVKQYLLTTPQGYRSIAQKKFGEGETATTMKNWGDERVFAVPTSFAESGSARMTAHFKLGKVGMVSPRLYYLDCFSNTGEIYVGYIGPHLTNTKS
jgi:hypothetical protein